MKYLPTIGLEIHFHLKTAAKMFCGCPNVDLAAPNTAICPVCTAQPGALPVINRQAVEWTALCGLALNCELAQSFNFERKNYFYPDLPKGYQITSTANPPCLGGYLEINGRQIRLNHIHLEEDTGSLKHSPDGKSSLVDLNRSGAPLVELVTEPDLTSGAEAKAFCQELQLILRTLKIADADMEKGQMRCEVNISLKTPKAKKLGVKVEIKNLNSFRAVERSIDSEIVRQTKALAEGEKIIQETRGWDEKAGTTFSQRLKEESHDYRYFPEPDLPPLTFDQSYYEKLRAELPELPKQKRARFASEYGFSPEDARLLTADQTLASFVEETISELREWLSTVEGAEGTAEEIWEKSQKKLMRLLGGWLTSELFKLINQSNIAVADLKITPENFAEFITLVYQNKVNSTAAQKILKIMFERGSDPSQIMTEEDLSQMDNEVAIGEIVNQIIKNNPEQVTAYQNGKVTLLQYFIGLVMRETKGKVNPETAKKLLEEKLR
ncbi:MAG: Asp-tRNA(Asn)/Glu-tRNA(Gln) amidotransferase subunit GatB [Patescibacteria group bacterium]|jgi:aspartyl-tRNA(Asn)/glutamyl-tRNA(Gln) amidotransferase subunit B